jgi:hypothetical protein
VALRASWRCELLRSVNWKNIAESVGVLAIVIGLFLVYEELRQNRTIARAELSAESARMFSVLDEQERDPDFARVLIKSREAPGELTSVERTQLNSYLHGALIVYIRERYNYQRGIFEEWTSLIRPTAPKYFGSVYGRAFWKASKRLYPPEIVAEVDEALTNVELIDLLQNRDAAIVEQLRQDQEQ